MDAEQQQPESMRYRVGCALLPKKAKRYLTPGMLRAACEAGVELVPIDMARPLEEQGPFHAILHKLGPDKAGLEALSSYLAAHPETRAVDPPDGIRLLQSRGTMLLPLAEGGGLVVRRPTVGSGACQGDVWRAEQHHHQQQQQEQQQQQQQEQEQPVAAGTPGAKRRRRDAPRAAPREPSRALVRAPRQVEIPEGTSAAAAAAALAAAGLSPPLLCKPLWTDGREGSHGLAVLHSMDDLGAVLGGAAGSELRPPLVVQQFLEHGGVLFKVYVMGRDTETVRRPSLSAPQLDAAAGVQKLPRVSCASALARHSAAHAAAAAAGGGGGAAAASSPRGGGEARGGGGSGGGDEARGGGGAAPRGDAVPTPPAWVTNAVAAAVRRRLGVMLFNFDMLCPLDATATGRGGGGDADADSYGCSCAGGGGGGDEGGGGSQQQQQQQQQQQEEQEEADGDDAWTQLYYVIDINPFPGIDKLPRYEQRLVRFLRAACEGEPPLPEGGPWATADDALGGGAADGGGAAAAGSGAGAGGAPPRLAAAGAPL